MNGILRYCIATFAFYIKSDRMPMKLFRLLTTIFLILASTTTRPALGSEIGTMAAAAGAKAAKPVVDTVSSVAAIPLAAADLVRLPMGVAQVGLAPLPGITFSDGFTNIGKGIIAPFKLVMGVLSFPHDLLNTLSGACESVSEGI
jgi:hypothetical protein